MDVDQRERSVRSAASRELWDVVRERAGLSGAGSMSKSNEDMGDAGADESVLCEYTEALLSGLVGHCSRRGSGASIGLSSLRSRISAGMAERGGGRRPEGVMGVETM